ncbi:GTPase of the mitochondrial inner membrane that associates with the large ribosomal subunit, partial [Oleoguttula sp. CCFEE 5521]
PTLTPFLYPCPDSTWFALRPPRSAVHQRHRRRWQTASSTTALTEAQPFPPPEISSHDYTNTPFTDSCTLTLHAGPGGHGCISFLHEKYIPDGPANGGDGGTGGAIYIQALRGETSLHKLARRGTLKAGRGKNGQIASKGGRPGEDVVLTVPVGPVVREMWRVDPIEEEEQGRRGKGFGADLDREEREESGEEGREGKRAGTDLKWRREKWLLYPGILPKSFTSADFPALPRPRRSNLTIS